MFVVLATDRLLFLGAVVLDVGAEGAHSLLQVVDVVKMI